MSSKVSKYIISISKENYTNQKAKFTFDKGMKWEQVKERLNQYFNIPSPVYIFLDASKDYLKIPLEDDEQLTKLVETTEKSSSFMLPDDQWQFFPSIRLYIYSSTAWAELSQRPGIIPPDEAWLSLKAQILKASDDTESVQLLCQQWAAETTQPNAQDDSGSSLLHYAMACDLPNLVEILVRVVDPLLLDSHGLSCLHVAILSNNRDCIARLLISCTPQIRKELLFQSIPQSSGSRSVSYTHLTLPTN